MFTLFGFLIGALIWRVSRASKRQLILGLLSHDYLQSLSGLNIVHYSGGVIGRWEVYVLLSLLEDEGLVVRKTLRHCEHLYWLTEKGVEARERWPK